MNKWGKDLKSWWVSFSKSVSFSVSNHSLTKNILLTVSFSSSIISLAKTLPSLLFPQLDQDQIQNCTFNCLFHIATWTFNKHLKLNVFGVECFISPETCSPTCPPHLSKWQLHSFNCLDRKHKSSLSALFLSYLISIWSIDHYSAVFKVCSGQDPFSPSPLFQTSPSHNSHLPLTRLLQ